MRFEHWLTKLRNTSTIRARRQTGWAASCSNATVATAFNSRVTDNIVRAGINYKFDPNEIWANY